MKRSRGNKFADIFYTLRRVLFITLLCAGVLAVVVLGAGFAIVKIGEYNLRKETAGQVPNLAGDAAGGQSGAEGDGSGASDGEEAPGASGEGEEDTAWQEGWVRYEGKVYEYKEDILTFLLLGIDKEGKVKAAKTGTDGGQSDAVFLLVADPEEKRISLIGVNRDTIVDVLMLGAGEDGEDIVYPSQLAVQHGFGDGLKESCGLTRDRVSELFYNLPIHAYASFNMGGIAELNDALGGVEVTVLEDMRKVKKGWTEGAELTLKGKDAFWYVKWRDTTVFESARGRLARQKQYINAFLRKAIAETKKDIRVPVNLYNSFKDYIVTDLTVDEIAYLAGELSGYSFNGDIYTLEGETEMMGEHEAFYPDKEALRRLLIEVFYREVDL